MTDYYVSPTGDDLAAGTLIAPWKRVKRAEAESPGANDTIHVTGTTVFAPLRAEALLGTTYRGNGLQYMLGTVNISDGATYGRAELTNHFQASTGWTLGGTANIQAVTKAIGANSAQLPGTASYLRKTIALNQGKFRFGMIYQCDSGNNIGWRVQNTNGAVWLNLSNNTWVGGSSAFGVLGTATAWAEVTTGWFNGNEVNNTFRLDIGIQSGANNTYVNQFYVEHMAEWSQYSGTTYQMYLKLEATPTALFKSETWSTDGAEGLVFCTKGTDKDTLNDGEWVYVAATNLLYYKLADGEDITTLRLEITDRAAAIYANALSQVAKSLIAIGYLQGFNSASTGALVATECQAIKCVKFGFLATDSSTMTLYSPFQNGVTGVDASTHGDGIFSQNTASITAYNPISINADDDAFQCRDGSTMILHAPLSYGNGGGCFETFSSFTGNYEIYNGTFYGNSNSVVFHDNSAIDNGRTQKAHGCIVYQAHATNEGATVVISGAGLDMANNYVFSEGTGAAATNFTSTEADPLFVDAGNNDFNLQASSPCVGTGPARWWTSTAARPTGGNGEPFPDFDIDIGACPSTHGPLHPSNV